MNLQDAKALHEVTAAVTFISVIVGGGDRECGYFPSNMLLSGLTFSDSFLRKFLF